MRALLFRTRQSREATTDPLGVLRRLAMEDAMRDARKPTACPECHERVVSLRSRGERVLVDLPSPSRPSPHRATVVLGDDGQAIELRDGQIPLEGQQAFVLHRLTCKVAMQAAREAAIDRMEDRGRRAVATA